MVVQEQTIVHNYLEIRSFTYDVLRHFFLEEPNKKLLKSLKAGQIEAFPFIHESKLINDGVKTIKRFFNGYEIDDVYEALHWDYTRMFIGPYELPAPLWESAYLNEDHLLFQKETLVVRLAYLKHNFLPEQYGREADDHLGLELDFLFQLNELTKKSIEAGDDKETKELINDQIDFINNHLLKWVPSLKEKVVNHAQFDFYKGMVQVLHGFLEIDRVCLEEFLTIEH